MALPFDLLLQGCRLPDGRIADVGARAGLVAEIGTLAGRSAHRAVDCGGLLLTPGLVDAHIHLDKALLARALESGADLVGGCPYNDTDAHAQIDIVFRLAREFDVDVDFHIDFFDEPEHMDVLYVAEQAVRWGWQGRVAVGHASELGALEPEELDRAAAMLKDAGVGVIILPATDLYLMGRKDVRNVRRGLAPAKRLLAAGVTVAVATNNILNAFTPMGTGDLALMGYLMTAAAHMGTERDVTDILAMLTEYPARMLRLPEHGLRVGARADLVLWETERAAEAVRTMAARRLVVKAGRLSIQHERTCTEFWRESS